MNHLVAPLTDIAAERRKQVARKLVSGLPTRANIEWVSLARYAERVPHRWFDRAVFDEFHAWASEPTRNNAVVAEFLSDRGRLDVAFKTLESINRQPWHDALPVGFLGGDLARIQTLEEWVHPAYLALVEGVLHGFLFAPAVVSRKRRGKRPQGLDVFNVVEELSANGLPLSCGRYDHTIRNGIAHGDVTFAQDTVTFVNRDKQETKSLTGMLRWVDDLVDITNSLALAIKCLLVESQTPVADFPRAVFLDELVDSVDSGWWRVDGFTMSEVIGGNQLNIYAHTHSRDVQKVLFAATHTAALSESHAPGFDRYFVSISSDVGLPGWAAFSGSTLASVRATGASDVADYAAAHEADGTFYSPKVPLPRWLSTMNTFRLVAIAQARSALDGRKSPVDGAGILTRVVEGHSDPLLCVNASVVVSGASPARLRSSANKIIRRAVRAARVAKPALFARPLGFARVSVYSRDYRRRRLNSYGLEEDLACVLTWRGDSRKRVLDIAGGVAEQEGKLRTVWNANWSQFADAVLSTTETAAPE